MMGVTIGFSRNMLVFPSEECRDLAPRPYAGLSDIIRTMDKAILKSSDENRIAVENLDAGRFGLWTATTSQYPA